MFTSTSTRRRLLQVALVVASALTLAALACGPTGLGATSVPIPTKSGESNATSAGGGATQPSSGGEATSTSGSNNNVAGEINASNVANLVDLHTATVSTQAVLAVAVSGSSHDIATAGADSIMQLWDGDTGKNLRRFPRLADYGFGLAYSRDGKLLASGAGFNVTIWDPSTGKKLKSVQPNGAVLRMAFSPDGKQLIVAGNGRSKLDEIDVDSGRVSEYVASPAGKYLYAVSYSKDGKLLAVGDVAGNMTVFDAQSKSVLGTGSAKGAVWDIQFSPDGKYVTTCNKINDYDPAGITTWDTSSFSEYSNLTMPDVHQAGCADGVYDKSGDIYFSGGGDGMLNAWEVATGKLLFSKNFGSLVWGVKISGDGKILAVAINDGTLHVMGLK